MPDTSDDASDSGAKRPDDKWAKRRESWSDKLVDAAANARQKAEDVASSPRTAEVRTNATGFLTTLRDSLKETTTALREGLNEKDDKTDDKTDENRDGRDGDGTAAAKPHEPRSAGASGDPSSVGRPRPRPRPNR